jgi:hypothetical protein
MSSITSASGQCGVEWILGEEGAQTRQSSSPVSGETICDIPALVDIIQMDDHCCHAGPGFLTYRIASDSKHS